MAEHHFRQREKRVLPAQPRHAEDRVQYLLEAEEKILRLVAARAPIPQILNGICTALDCQIGNMVSLISLPEDNVMCVAEMARSASRFGLHIFFSRNILDDDGLALGSLEMFCCTARAPSCEELQWIERAACLAAIAMKGATKPSGQANRGFSRGEPTLENTPRSPVCIN